MIEQLFPGPPFNGKKMIPVKMTVIALCVYMSCAQAQTTINAGVTETIPGTRSSPWIISGNLAIDGTMHILANGMVNNVIGFIGANAGSSGEVTVTDPGSSWTNSNTLTVGSAGTGRLTISDGGAVSSTGGVISYNTGSTGIVSIDGTGSAWTNGGQLSVGTFGVGTLIITDGGAASNTGAMIGNEAAGIGTVTVDGDGSTWTSSDFVHIGRNGTGTLNIFNGGTAIASATASIGYDAGSIGTGMVDGEGSTWTISDYLAVGLLGNGSLTIANGGRVSNNIGFIGSNTNGNATGFGTVTVDGEGSRWTNTAPLYVGSAGTGRLTISDGGTVSNTLGYIGVNPSGDGTVSVSGNGSRWTNTATLYVGSAGTGRLTISDGGTVSNTLGYIGVNPSGDGTVSVSGTGSRWTNSNILIVGNSGTGSLAITDGGAVSNFDGYIGSNSGGTGSVHVSGTGSRWTNSNTLTVGNSGTGSLAITDGGAVSTNYGYVGYYVSGIGAVSVDGTGSTWINSGNLAVGYQGIGALAIRNHGLVSAGDVYIARYSTAGGSLDVTSGGILQLLSLNAGDGSVAAIFDGGILRAVADNPAFMTGFAPAELVIASSGLIIDDNGYDIATDTSAFSGVGGLTKTGTGILTLGGANTYSGATTVTSGTLKAGTDGVFSQTSAFTVHAGATLDLDGYNQSVAGLANSGIVHIGSGTSANSVGTTLNINGNYESNGGSLHLRTTLGDDASPTDKLIVGSVSTAPGWATRLYVTNIGGVGDTTIEGIQVVQVATTSSSNAFVLGAPVTAGVYEYVLYQSANQSWYLTNNIVVPLPSEEFATWQYIYNPNIGSYLGNQYAAATMFNQNILDRRDSTRSPDQTIWMRSNYNRAQSDILNGKQEVTIKTGLLQIGADLIEQDNLVAGVYAGYGHSDIDNKSRQTGTSADGKVNGYQVGIYGSWLPDNNVGLFADVWTYYAWYDNKLSGAAQYRTTKYDSTGYALSGEIGYGFELSQQENGSSWILEPHAQLIYTHIDADDFYDSHGTWYSSNKGSGIQTRLGARLYGQNAPGQHGVNPFIEANWLHNNLDSGVSLNGYQVSSDIGKNVGEFKIGLQGQVTDRLSVWGHVGAQRGSQSFKRYEFQLGLGWQW